MGIAELATFVLVILLLPTIISMIPKSGHQDRPAQHATIGPPPPKPVVPEVVVAGWAAQLASEGKDYAQAEAIIKAYAFTQQLVLNQETLEDGLTDAYPDYSE